MTVRQEPVQIPISYGCVFICRHILSIFGCKISIKVRTQCSRLIDSLQRYKIIFETKREEAEKCFSYEKVWCLTSHKNFVVSTPHILHHRFEHDFSTCSFYFFAAIAAMLQDSLIMNGLRMAAKWQSGSKLEGGGRGSCFWP